MVEAFLTVLVTAMIEASASPQQVECTNCSDYAGLAGVILAVAALVVSALSLYARALELHGMLLIRDPQDTHEFARQLRRLESVEFEVAHKYLRPGFVRRGRKRTVLKKQRVKVDAGYLRKSAKGQWGKHEAYADEARIFAGES